MIAARASGFSKFADDGMFPNKISLTVQPQPDMFIGLTKAYYEKLGLTDEKLLRQYTLFASQYDKEPVTDIVSYGASSFHQQSVLINELAAAKGGVWQTQLEVPMSRLTNLDKFGVSTEIFPDGVCRLIKFNPIPMIDWSDMQKADIISVRGNSSVASGIRWATSSNFAHTGMYDGNDNVIESLDIGPDRTSKKQFLLSCGNIVMVQRHFMMNPAAADSIVRNAETYLDGGRNDVEYDLPGAILGGGTRTTTGKIVAFGISPFVDISQIDRAKNLLLGKNSRLYCSEAVAVWYGQQGLKLSTIPTERVAPSQYETFVTLNKIGYLRYMV